MGKPKRSILNVLRHLATCESDEWTAANRLPDGNGHCSGGHSASGDVLRSMRDADLIEYGKAPLHSLYGYRITDAGRAALSEATTPPSDTGRRGKDAGSGT